MTRRTRPQRSFLAAETRRAGRPAVLPVLLGCAGGLAAILQAWLVATSLAAVLQGAAAVSVLPALGGAALLVLLRALLVAWQDSASVRASAALRRDLRARLFARITALGPAWTEARESGALASALVDQTEALGGFYARWLPAVALAALLPVVAALVAFGFDTTIGIGLLLLPPVAVAAMAAAGIGAARAARDQFGELARMGAHFLDRMRGLATLVVLNQQDAEATRIAAVAENFRRRTMAVMRVALLTSVALEAVFVTAVALVALRAGLAFNAGTLRLADGLFLLLLVPELFAPMRALLAAYHDRQQAAGVADSLAAILAEPAPAAGTRDLPDAGRAEVSVQDAWVTYPGRARPALAGVSFEAAPGDCVVLMGESGAGKSTLLDLLLGLRAPDRGQVLLNGVPVHELSPQARGGAITWIGSRPKLFAGTLRDNLLLAKPDATEPQLLHALGQAQLGRVLARLPQGLDSQVGEGGFGLSGGEAQRVAIARAWLRNAPLLLLDEPTAHLDPDTAALVLESLRSLAAGRTVVMASHAPDAALSGRVVRLGAEPVRAAAE